MIRTEDITIAYTNDISEIENSLKNNGIIPLRWSVVAVDKTHLTLSVSFECE